MRWSNISLLLACLALGIAGFLLGRSRHAGGPGHRVISPLRTAGPANSPAPSSIAADAKAGAGADALSEIPRWSSRWRESLAEPNTPKRNKKLAALIAERAKTNPQEALELARTVDDWRLRDLLHDSALRGWASAEPNAAADYALTVREDDRRRAVEAVMQGAAASPAAAVRVALRLCSTDPERGGDYGHYTIAALVENGAFADAVRFGEQVGPDKYPFLLKSAFFQWARNQPAEAVAALNDIADPVLRGQAESEAISGWAWADPKGLAAYALTLPAGSARREAVAEALPRWVEKDPSAAAEWMRQHEASGETDSGVAAVANLQSIITQQPATAMTMASNLIADPTLRSHTMRTVFRQWAENDPPSAKQYLDRTQGADRELLLKELRDLLPD